MLWVLTIVVWSIAFLLDLLACRSSPTMSFGVSPLLETSTN